MGSSSQRRLTALLVVGVPCIAAVTYFGELSPGALIAVSLTGTMVSGLTLADRTGAGAPPVGRRGLPWSAWVTVVLGVELWMLTIGTPTLSDLLDPVLAVPPMRGAATAAWLAVGGWLLLCPPRSSREETAS